jgi:transcriptional regulator with GAF, ATPase, and Fis domain
MDLQKVLFILLLAGTLLFLGHVYYRMIHAPSIWISTDMDLTVSRVIPGGPGEAAGIRKGDRIVAVEGERITGIIPGLKLASKHAQIGRRISLTVERGNVEKIFQVTPTRKYQFFSSRPYAIPALILGLLWIALGLFVYLKKPSAPGARFFYILCLSSTVFIVGIAVQADIFEVPLLIAVWAVVGGMNSPLFFHFALCFPREKAFLAKRRFLYPLLYTPSLILLAAIAAFAVQAASLAAQGKSDFSAFNTMEQLSAGFIPLKIFFYLGGGISIILNYFTDITMEEKRQIRCLFWAFVLIPLVIIPFVPSMLRDYSSFVDEDASLLVLLAFSILLVSFAIAIFKYRLMDIELVMSRGFAYLIVGLFIVFLLGLGWLSNVQIKEHPGVAIVLASLFVTMTFQPMKNRAQTFVDQRFFRDRFGYREGLLMASQSLTTLLNRDAILKATLEGVAESLHLRKGAFFLLDSSSGQYGPKAVWGDIHLPQGLKLNPGDLIPSLMKEQQTWISRFEIKNYPRYEGQREKLTEAMEKIESEVMIPILYKNQLRGFIGLGPKHSKDLFSTEELELTQTLANQAATSLENAAAYIQVEGLNRELETKIEKIEQQQEQILALQDKLIQENVYLKEEIKSQYDFEEIIGTSPAIKKVLETVAKVASTPSTLLLQGESGTGKELIARAIHFNSQRKNNPFVKVNCAALPEGLLESELFGHEKGAFTGATNQKIGRFELAREGTIFLDEVGDMSPNTQLRLLRVLQEKEFERVGGTKTISVDVRVIAATNRDLETLISTGKFREDLFYRLNVVSLTIPSLRDRRPDIYQLVVHFMNKYNKTMGKNIRQVDAAAMESLVDYPWPGNVRELENVIERAIVLAEGETLTAEDLPAEVFNYLELKDATSGSQEDRTLPEMMGSMEKRQLISALEEARGNKSKAARILGLSRSTFWHKLKKHDLL